MDPVGNITDIDQPAPPVSNGLGGKYDNHYHYDQQYRLIQSDGNGDFSYKFSAVYSPTGRMGNKYTATGQQQADILFGYDRQRMPHQPRTLFDPHVGTLEFYWDANGNLAQMIGCKLNSGRLHEWDEENRLRFVLGERFAGYYGYDANGERVYKLTGISSIDQVNSGSTKAQAIFDDAVLYPNPYMVVTQRGYTKHYYAGTERLATVIGGGLEDRATPMEQFGTQREWDIVDAFYRQYQTDDPFLHGKLLSGPTPTEDIDHKQNPDLDYQCKPVFLDYVDVLTKTDILFEAIDKNTKVNSKEDEVYFYHGDHLGSANWITDIKGDAIQYIHYAPYGEMVDNQRAVGYNERFKFTGKERDRESGYDYFGARYYSSPFSHWLSVDPLAEKYPNISPYAYCGWNSVKYVDPNGKWLETAWDIANVAMDAVSLESNIKDGNFGAAMIDGVGLVLDLGAAILPVVPGGAGTAIKAYRTADKVVDATKVATTSGKNIATATKNTYRQALQKATGKIGKGYEAHHTLPQKYRNDFEKLGINIDEPGNVVWRKSEGHRAKNAEHGKAWDEFFKNSPTPTKEQVLQQRDIIEKQVWSNAPTGEIPPN